MKKMLARRIKWIYVATLLLSLHYAFTVYINSSFLSQFFNPQYLSMLYVAGAALTVFVFIFSASVIKKISLGRFIIAGIILEIVALLGLFSSSNLFLISIFFLMHAALPTLLLFGLDVFLEDTLRTEEMTGRVRSNYLTIINIAFVISPLVVGKIIDIASYRAIYLISAAFCIMLFFVVGDELQPLKVRSLEEVNFTDSIRRMLRHQGLRLSIFLDILLQSFYAIMVIYLPIYLHVTVGFDWSTIGILFTVMLLPFVLFEAPLGRLFDHRKVVVDTLVIGFLMLILTTASIALTHSTNPVFWAFLLFASRVGASFVEVSTEYSFFRRVTGRDAGFISLFRMSGPTAYIIIPLLAQAVFPMIAFQGIFLSFSAVLVLGIVLSLKLSRAR